MPTFTRTARVQTTPKRVEYAAPPGAKWFITKTVKVKTAKSFTSVALPDQRRQEIAIWVSTIETLIASGKPIPEEHYRSDVDRNVDSVLRDLGINHIHFEPSSSEILYFIELEDRVIFLCVDDHWPFNNPGSAVTNLKKRYGDRIARIESLNDQN